MAKRKKISDFDKSIEQQLKKNRVFSKTIKTDIKFIDIVKTTIEKILLIDKYSNDINSIIIFDKLYTDDFDIESFRYFLTSDNYSFIINNNTIYKQLKQSNFNINRIKLMFFDIKNGITNG